MIFDGRMSLNQRVRVRRQHKRPAFDRAGICRRGRTRTSSRGCCPLVAAREQSDRRLQLGNALFHFRDPGFEHTHITKFDNTRGTEKARGNRLAVLATQGVSSPLFILIIYNVVAFEH
jgi:hypothetical protein